jgi:hypothetical protein
VTREHPLTALWLRNDPERCPKELTPSGYANLRPSLCRKLARSAAATLYARLLAIFRKLMARWHTWVFQQSPRRRTPGLRREEVARLAGVSFAWDTFSEQGRPLRASEAVPDWLAQVPRMLVTRNLTTPLSAECSSSQ